MNYNNPCVCNIKNCSNPHYNDFLCKQHYHEYVTDKRISKILNLLYKEKTNQKLTFKQKSLILIFRILHGLFYITLPFAEHYPLESVFYYHYINTLRRLSKEDKKKESIEKLKKLLKDFDYTENKYLPKIHLYLSHISPSSVNLSVGDYILKPIISNLIPSSINFLITTGLTVTLLLSTYFCSQILNIKTKLFFDINIYHIGLITYIALGLIYFCLNFIHSVDALIFNAINNKLYVTEKDNFTFIQQFLYAKSEIRKTFEFLVYHRLSGVFMIAVLVFSKILESNFSLKEFAILFITDPIKLILPEVFQWSYYEIILTFLLNSLLLFLLYRIFLIYPIYARISPQICHMSKSDFKINIYDLDRRLGIGELIDMNTYYAITNINFIITIWIISYSFDVGCIWIVLFIATSLLRIDSIKHSYLLYKHLREEAAKKINTELSSIPKLQFSEQIQKHDFVLELSPYPIILPKRKKALSVIFTTIIFPIILLIADKKFNIIDKMLIKFSEILFK